VCDALRTVLPFGEGVFALNAAGLILVLGILTLPLALKMATSGLKTALAAIDLVFTYSLVAFDLFSIDATGADFIIMWPSILGNFFMIAFIIVLSAFLTLGRNSEKRPMTAGFLLLRVSVTVGYTEFLAFIIAFCLVLSSLNEFISALSELLLSLNNFRGLFVL